MSKTYSITHYEDIDRIERKHFWFLARNEMLRKVITACLHGKAVGEHVSSGGSKQHKKKEGNGTSEFLEVGCGTGIVIRLLEFLGFAVTGLDINKKALDFARNGTHASLVQKSFLTYRPAKRFDAVGMFDVIEHIKNDAAFLSKARVALKPHGMLFITVPAGKWLWSELDPAAGHERRYEPDEIIQKVRESGFDIVFWNYWGVFTLPLFFFWRKLSAKNLNGNSLDDYFSLPNPIINFLLLIIHHIEHTFLFTVKWGKGASIVLCAVKNGK
jgi:SAM-dependent methyltransferase